MQVLEACYAGVFLSRSARHGGEGELFYFEPEPERPEPSVGPLSSSSQGAVDIVINAVRQNQNL